MIVLGLALDSLGHGRQYTLAQGEHAPELRTRSYAIPAGGLRGGQPSRIPINVSHDRASTIGEVLYLEQTQRGLWCLGELDEDYSPGVDVRVGDQLVRVETDLYYSTEIDARRDGTDAVLEGLAITPRPAQIGLQPLLFIEGTLDTASPKDVWDSGLYERDMIERAREYRRRRRWGEPLRVRNMIKPEVTRLRGGGFLVDGDLAPNEMPDPDRPYGKLRVRPGKILRVS